MEWAIEFFSAEVKREIDAWPLGIRAVFVRVAQRMQSHGPNLGMPFTRAFGDGLFEIRAKGREGIGRAFFCLMVGRRIVILHGFIKKTDRTPHTELETAIRRMKEVENERRTI
ncbi:MAG: type II toxin-antitoxin system RelE/ParE family toxin [Magnetococcales bacterium]|nr:type II toxin-antitoxin system RelE/ParE family toxin [Magnetococcales bacterium]